MARRGNHKGWRAAERRGGPATAELAMVKFERPQDVRGLALMAGARSITLGIEVGAVRAGDLIVVDGQTRVVTGWNERSGEAQIVPAWARAPAAGAPYRLKASTIYCTPVVASAGGGRA